MADEKRVATPSGRSAGIGWSGIGMRWGAALLLVLITYNPVMWSYWRWISDWSGADLASKVFVGLIIATGYVVYFRATAGSLGRLGTVFFVAIFGGLMWLLMSKGIITADAADGSTLWTWIFLIGLSVYLALGMTGSFLWKRLTGQLDIADSDVDHNHS